MKVIAITGGIGSGKSKVSHYLSNKGYPIYSADIRSKEILLQNSIRQKIIEILGVQAYIKEDDNYSINKVYIASKIFSNEKLRKQMEAIVHPEVRIDFENWIDQQQCELIFQESAIVLTSKTPYPFDKIIYIDADLEKRIEMIIKRDGSSRDQILQLIEAQPQLEDHFEQIDYLIYNNFDNSLFEKIDALIKDLKKTI